MQNLRVSNRVSILKCKKHNDFAHYICGTARALLLGMSGNHAAKKEIEMKITEKKHVLERMNDETREWWTG